MQYLKQSTAVTLKIGPFLDDTDGKAAETALVIAQADVRISKNGANIISKSDANNCTHDELGIYGCPLNITDTNASGRFQLWVHESGALPVWHEYMVVPTNVYDSLFSTDKLQVDTVQISGDETATNNLEADYDGTGYTKTNSTIGTCTANTDMITAGTVNAQVVDVMKTDTTAEPSQGSPPAAPTFEDMIAYIYFRLRNKTTTTSSEDAMWDNAGTTKLIKATISDNGTTFEKSEYVSGA